ncbi:hypothetical protein PBV87_09420 [Niameybacter massiliensis]|uniref:Uncharacterized protein n=1 Tax=Holtiella tumoricola TaxID=3018743 RepID=A0AA42DME9_9FIRM|nr:hypothetical protein [Holtiella tumoricola]MDA3731695.1 hypothetical protein [Holtiella tumoricola]
MLTTIEWEEINQTIDFAWACCKEIHTTCYPLRKTKEDLAAGLKNGFNYVDDEVLGYFEENTLKGVINLYVERPEKYIQARVYVLNHFDKVMEELLIYLHTHYEGFEVQLGYPKENVMAIQWLKAHGYTCIEASNDLRLNVTHLKRSTKNYSHVSRLSKEDFKTYAFFHDIYAQGMYWNSRRLEEDFNNWYIHIYKDEDHILGSIFTRLCKDNMAEVFGVFVKDQINLQKIYEALLNVAFIDILDHEAHINCIVFFIDETDPILYEEAEKIGFKYSGSYQGYLLKI